MGDARRFCLRLLLAAGVFSAISACFAADQYFLSDLGPLGTATSHGMAINASAILAGAAGDSETMLRAFLSQGGSGRFLSLPGDFSVPRGINSSGRICGYWSDSASGAQGAFLSVGSAGSNLPPAYGMYARAYAINDSNVCVGASALASDFSDSVATVWAGGVGSSVPGTQSPSAVWGINQSGEIVGETAVAGMSGPQPFALINGFLTILPLPDSTFQGGAAYAVNDQGNIVGVGYSLGVEHSLLWRNGTIIDLGTLPSDNDGDEGEMAPHSINNSDQVVGDIPSGDYEDDAVCFLWQSGTTYDLNALLLNAPGYVMVGAQSINDFGEIAGTAVITDQLHAVLLTPDVELDDLTVVPSAVRSGQSAMGQIVLNRPALPGGVSVSLMSSDSDVASVPPDVTIPAGQSSASFPVTTHATASDQTAMISGMHNGVTVSAPLLVEGTNPRLISFVLTPHSTFDGMTVTGIVTLRDPAPAAGARVSFTNTSPSVASCPSSLIVPRGQISKSFTTTGHAPRVGGATTMTASLYGVSISDILHVATIELQSLDFTSYSGTGGVVFDGAIHIPVRAPTGGYRVNLVSSNTAAATVASSVTIPAGATSAIFHVTTKPVHGTTFATITASHNSYSLARQLQVLPPQVSSFTISPTSTRGGRSVSGRVTLTGKAPAGGMTVQFSAYPNLANVPGTVTVSAGASTASFTIQTSTVSANTPVTLRAWTLDAVRTAILTLTP